MGQSLRTIPPIWRRRRMHQITRLRHRKIKLKFKIKSWIILICDTVHSLIKYSITKMKDNSKCKRWPVLGISRLARRKSFRRARKTCQNPRPWQSRNSSKTRQIRPPKGPCPRYPWSVTVRIRMTPWAMVGTRSWNLSAKFAIRSLHTAQHWVGTYPKRILARAKPTTTRSLWGRRGS